MLASGTSTTLTREQPLNPGNLVAMDMSSTCSGSPAGVVNSGYWGGKGFSGGASAANAFALPQAAWVRRAW